LVIVLFPNFVFAARPDSLEVLISDSRPSTVADYTITHDQATAAQFTSGDTLVVSFPAGFDLTALSEPSDYDFKVASTDETLQSAACGATDTVRVSVSSQDITFEACSSYTAEAADSVIEIQIGTNADTGVNQITNHAVAATYTVTSNTTDEDTQDALIAIIGGVDVSATIDETLTHTTAGVTTGNCPDPGGAGSETEIDTSGDPTTVPFGTVNTESFYGACQQVTVTTNGAGGYTTTVQTTSLLTSGPNTIAKGTCDGACTDTSEAAWATNTNNGFGYCMADQTGNPATTADAGWGTNACDDGTTFFKTHANAGAAESAQSILASATPVSGDSAYIKYRLSVDGTQAAGTYTTTVVYITTPTF